MSGNSTTQRNKPAAPFKTLATLESNECRWPIGDPQSPDFHFCGELRGNGQTYCATHAAQASTPSRPRAFFPKRGD